MRRRIDVLARKMIGVYDLPDRASAPYSVTWDTRRKVAWMATSNANLIYRFDPRYKSFAVLPLPREGAFLRMIGIDKTSQSDRQMKKWRKQMLHSVAPRVAGRLCARVLARLILALKP